MKASSIFKFASSFMLVFLVGALLSLSFGLSPIIGGAILSTSATALSVIGQLQGYTFTGSLFAVPSEVWVRDIAENLFNGSEHVTHAIDDSSLIVNNVVHLPQAGAAPVVEKNRSTFPASIAERTDTEVTYTVDNYTSDPIRVRNYEELQTSYAKRQNVLGEHMAKLNEEIGDQVAYEWAPSGTAVRVFRTSGASTATAPTGATGLRKRVVLEDLVKLAERLDNDKLPSQGRFLLIPATMYYNFIGVDQLIGRDTMNSGKLPTGVIDKILGFNIMVRSTVNIYDNASDPVKKAVGAAAAATDNFGAIAWSQYATRKALGSIQAYINPNVAEHYGDILSAEVNFGARARWTDQRGIAALVQDAA